MRSDKRFGEVKPREANNDAELEKNIEAKNITTMEVEKSDCLNNLSNASEERQWAEAATYFFEAFKNYDEARNQRRIQCLKYLFLANMLMESKLNPFDGQEARPYKNVDPAMKDQLQRRNAQV
ncbi:hypothetical protein SESBI_28174 [Sesbania bispinosa]|nr:hypothetical protein SESBI_28174 [Sesbania bispinosa]